MSKGGKSAGFGSAAAVIILIFIAVNVIGGNKTEIGKSTVKREKLENTVSVQTEYYTDELGWVEAPSDLEEGMKAFSEKTGVLPYLYITGEINGGTSPDVSDMEEFCKSRYGELFSDEKHLLVVFFEHEKEHKVICFSGKEAAQVMDKEAQSILTDHIEKYYSRFGNRAKKLSKAFEKTGIRIMKITRPAVFYLFIMAVVITALAVTQHMCKKAVRKNRLKKENMKKLLETPIETFEDSEAEKLAEKYE